MERDAPGISQSIQATPFPRKQSRAKADNSRSRRVLGKIGATFEGILRQDKIEPNGHPRNTAFYSIVREEWPGAKARLSALLASHQGHAIE